MHNVSAIYMLFDMFINIQSYIQNREPLRLALEHQFNRLHNVSAIYMGVLTISIRLPRVSAFVQKRVKQSEL
jgi:hypothetical protein